MRRRRGFLFWGALLGVVLALGCAHGSGPRSGGDVVHVLRRGETLYRLSRYYGVPVQRIARANDIHDARDLAVGRRLRIPGARRPPPDHPLLPSPDGSVPVTLTNPHRRPGPPPAGPRPRFSWPLHGILTSPFGWRWHHMHEGIDIAAPPGTPIHAAAPGRVIYSGRLGGYGNVVIVQHRDDYASVYAHNRHNRVRKGAIVQRGQVLAVVGQTGDATGPHLHFEIRRDEKPENPLRFLP